MGWREVPARVGLKVDVHPTWCVFVLNLSRCGTIDTEIKVSTAKK